MAKISVRQALGSPIYQENGETFMNIKGSTETTINSGLYIPLWTVCNVTYPNNTTEVFTFNNSGSPVAVVTIVYTDSTKANILSITKS